MRPGIERYQSVLSQWYIHTHTQYNKYFEVPEATSSSSSSTFGCYLSSAYFSRLRYRAFSVCIINHCVYLCAKEALGSRLNSESKIKYLVAVNTHRAKGSDAFSSSSSSSLQPLVLALSYFSLAAREARRKEKEREVGRRRSMSLVRGFGCISLIIGLTLGGFCLLLSFFNLSLTFRIIQYNNK